MLVKEYRIPMPLSVDEYRIAQLYMIQKKSREESSGSGSRVEILVNEPYVNGPGGTNGQYTHKVYHIGSHLPGWIKALLPKSALRVEEKAWNAYPYTKTRFTCPFLEKFSIEVETYYFPDAGTQDNVFNLTRDDLRRRTLDVINIASDKLPSSAYKVEEDPLHFVSDKSGRGPLSANWLEEEHDQVMCSYKLCKVEFRYWGMQTRVERFIDDVALRRTMLQAHRQAWCWQDEWVGLEMADVRRLERETQAALQSLDEGDADVSGMSSEPGNNATSVDPSASTASSPATGKMSRRTSSNQSFQSSRSASLVSADSSRTVGSPEHHDYGEAAKTRSLHRRKTSFGTHVGQDTVGEVQLEEEMALMRMDAIEVVSVGESDSDSDVYYDAQQELSESQEGLFRCDSIEIEQKLQDEEPNLSRTDDETTHGDNRNLWDGEDDSRCLLQSLESTQTFLTSYLSDSSHVDTLVLVFHGGTATESSHEMSSKTIDCQTMQSTLDQIIKKHYRFAKGRVATRLVACPAVCKSAIDVLSRISPNPEVSKQSSVHAGASCLLLESLALFAVSQPEYQEIVVSVIVKANEVFEEFLQSAEGQHFAGSVCVVGDCMGGLLAYDALCYHTSRLRDLHSSSPSPAHSGVSHSSSSSSLGASGGSSTFPRLTAKGLETLGIDDVLKPAFPAGPRSASPVLQRQTAGGFPHIVHVKPSGGMLGVSGSGSGAGSLVFAGVIATLAFDVSDLFVLGCPLGHIIAFRQLSQPTVGHPVRPNCSAVYNLFHCWDPVAYRLEPLLDERFASLPAVDVPQYEHFPLGDENSHKITTAVQSHSDIFPCRDSNVLPSVQVDIVPSQTRRLSTQSAASSISSDQSLCTSFEDIGGPAMWWSQQRLDYAIYCPEAVKSFPRAILSTWMHASYWESKDVAAFVLRKILHERYTGASAVSTADGVVPFLPMQPRERWNHKKTGYKISTLSAYHRGHDLAFLESHPQTLSARFAYGPLDLVSLIGETVDIYVLSPAALDWMHVGTADTDKKGRLQFAVPQGSQLPCGVHEMKMLVRGDHTVADCSLLVLHSGVQAVVFSIDGSFAGSMSIRGKNPKLRQGAVEVVRHWQELGYLIVYVTGRPDMQKPNVTTWMAQNSFPCGMVFFCDGLARDPQSRKAAFLHSLQDDVKIKICSAYGSKKDIKLYQELGLDASQIMVVAKSKMGRRESLNKYQVQVVEDYSKHLEQLQAQLPPSTCPRIPMRKKQFMPLKPRSQKKKKKRDRSNARFGWKESTATSSTGTTKLGETSV